MSRTFHGRANFFFASVEITFNGKKVKAAAAAEAAKARNGKLMRNKNIELKSFEIQFLGITLRWKKTKRHPASIP